MHKHNNDERHGIIKGKQTKLDDYMAQEEAKLLKEMSEKMEKEKKEEEEKRLVEEKNKLKELHYMHCPKCGMDLQEVEFMEVMVDVCEDCLGIWLDHGELETIILKESGFFSSFKKKVGLKKIEHPLGKIKKSK